jgi:hypothetical protein
MIDGHGHHSIHASFRGDLSPGHSVALAVASDPGISHHNLWIPGSTLARRPGMTSADGAAR